MISAAKGLPTASFSGLHEGPSLGAQHGSTVEVHPKGNNKDSEGCRV